MPPMGRGQRIGLIVAALAVAALAFVLLSPSDSDDDDDKTPTTATQQTRPQKGKKQGDGKPAPKPKPAFAPITVKGGEPAGGVQRVTVRKGSTVRLEVRSDEAGEIHIHGYDVAKDVAKGKPARFTFKADLEGAFEIEVEDTKTEIGQLVVEP
jgi:FtsP/CotA-like multicopper oxidase with cupredoxin domain